MRTAWLITLALVACKSGESDKKPTERAVTPAPTPAPTRQEPDASVPQPARPDAPRETIVRSRRFAVPIPDGFERKKTGQILAGNDVMLVAAGPRYLYVMRIGLPKEMHGADAKGCDEVAARVTQTGAKLVKAEIVKHARFGNVCRSVHRNDGKIDDMLVSYAISLGEKDMLVVQCGYPGGGEAEYCTRALDDVQLDDDPTKKRPK